MWLRVALALVAGAVSVVLADLEHTCVHGQDLKTGLCGEQLSELLKFLCGNDGYNGFDKRSAIAPEAPTFKGDMQADVSAHRVFVPPQRALAVLGGPGSATGVRQRRRRRDLLWQSAVHGYQGIVCECCYNHCDVTELTQYCANGGQLTRIGRRSPTHGGGYYP